jgi:hypothetical protein
MRPGGGPHGNEAGDRESLGQVFWADGPPGSRIGWNPTDFMTWRPSGRGPDGFHQCGDDFREEPDSWSCGTQNWIK